MPSGARLTRVATLLAACGLLSACGSTTASDRSALQQKMQLDTERVFILRQSNLEKHLTQLGRARAPRQTATCAARWFTP